MKIAYFPLYLPSGASDILAAFVAGCAQLGLTTVPNSMNADAAVIWSVLWAGRMKPNKQIYEHYRKHGKPVFIIEVGAIHRGVTWKVALNNITASGDYGLSAGVDPTRIGALKLAVPPVKATKPSILIAAQQPQSLQWKGMPPVETWIMQTIKTLRQWTDRPIVVRPHPRARLGPLGKGVTVQYPTLLNNTYSSYDLEFDYWAIVNHSSGPGIQAAIRGASVIVGTESLAYPVSQCVQNIETPVKIDITNWLADLAHTEWTVSEISQGIPQARLLHTLT